MIDPVGLFGFAIKIILVFFELFLSIFSQLTARFFDFAIITLAPATLEIIG